MRVILADDSLLFRAGLVRLLADQGFDVVLEADNGDDLVRRVGGLRPDVAVIDIRMPPSFTDEGLQAAQRLATVTPRSASSCSRSTSSPSFAMRLIEQGSGGRGYLLKDRVADLDAFGASFASRRGRLGRRPAGRRRARQQRQRRRRPRRRAFDREREILGLMAEGRSNNGIGERLVLSRRTVESHVRTIFRKLGLPSADDDNRRVLAVLAFLRGALRRARAAAISGSIAVPPPAIVRMAADELGDVADAFLEQVADTFATDVEQPLGSTGLHALREHEHAHAGMVDLDARCGAQALVGVGVRHAPVEDDHVGPDLGDALVQALGVGGLQDDVHALGLEHPARGPRAAARRRRQARCAAAAARPAPSASRTPAAGREGP